MDVRQGKFVGVLDRKQVPSVKDFENVSLPKPETIILPNGIPVYIIRMGDQDVCRIDVIFSAGRYNEEKTMAAIMTNLMLKEGSSLMSSSQIAENLDYYGAWLQTSASFHNSYVTLYSLNKYFSETLKILDSLIWSPTFPEKEFEILALRRKQQLMVEQEKVQNLAAQAFFECLFGASHPYGRKPSIESFDSLTRNDLLDYHQEYYIPKSCMLLLTGKVTDEMLVGLFESFGRYSSDIEVTKEKEISITMSSDREIWVEKDNALQSAVRIGCPVVGREHPDFVGLRILNTVLGGYFGSRLMLNIRENKGYTYGISSSVIGQQKGAYLSISTQTATEYTQPLIAEVYSEIEKLRKELIGEEELSMVRSYLLGELSRLSDGPFSVADAYVSMLANRTTFDYFEKQADSIRNIKSEDLLCLAEKYFSRDVFYTVVAGDKF